MTGKPKPTPERYCQQCGIKLERKIYRGRRLEALFHFTKRKYCERRCSDQARKERPKKETSVAETLHWRARNMIPHGPCTICGKENALDVHHKDGNPHNNVADNLVRICRSCHMKEHRPISACTICGRPAKGHGYCEKHYLRFKKYGDPLKTKIPVKSLCSVCGEPAHSRQLCAPHYYIAKRDGLLGETKSEKAQHPYTLRSESSQ